MAKKDKKPIVNGKKTEKKNKPDSDKEGRNPDGSFAPGNRLSVGKGRPLGSESFRTKFKRAIEVLAAKEGKTFDELEADLIRVGFKNARSGDYHFYQDVMDRNFGKPKQPLEVGHPEDDALTEAQIKLAEAETEAWERQWIEDDKKSHKGTESKGVEKPRPKKSAR